LADCSEYLELISRSVDGDLSAEEAEMLYEHLAHCPSCSATLSSFEELSMMTADSLKQPPAQLHEGVMASIEAAKKRPWYTRYRFTAVAACFALVVLAISYTPLGDFLVPAQENQVLTEDSARTVPATGDSEEATLDTASEPAPMMRSAEAPKNSAAVPAKPEAAGSDSNHSAKQEFGASDPSLVPQTPYNTTFAKYLMFSASEAPEVLYSITSDQTVDSVVYYIVTAEEFAAVQSALLEAGVEISVVQGDSESTESLLVLTVTE